MNLSTATPVEIDTKLAELYMAEAKARHLYNRIQQAFVDEQVAKVEGKYYYNPFTQADEQDAYEKLHAIIEQELPLEAEYERRPWQRYWHVTNNNGHIHDSQSCSSCYPDTQYAWRTDLSGLRDTEVVEREAYNACSVCMPIAPAEQQAARKRYNEEQRAQRAAERQAKKDAKAQKARERAVKLVDKVEKEIEKLGGRQVFFEDYSLYGKDGRKSVYDATFDMQATVGDILYEMKDRQESGRSHYSMNEHVRAELESRGLMSR